MFSNLGTFHANGKHVDPPPLGTPERIGLLYGAVLVQYIHSITLNKELPISNPINIMDAE